MATIYTYGGVIINIDWVKLPAIFWGVLAIYDSLVFKDALTEINRYLKENKRRRTKILDWVASKDKRKEIEGTLTRLEAQVKESNSELGRVKDTVHKAMIVIPTATISMLLIQSCIYLLNIVTLKKFYWYILSDWSLVIPKTLNTVILIFCIAYLYAIKTTLDWKNKPKKLYQDVLEQDKILLEIVDTKKIPKKDQEIENKCLSCLAQRIEHLSSLQVDQVDCENCWTDLSSRKTGPKSPTKEENPHPEVITKPKGLEPDPAAASN